VNKTVTLQTVILAAISTRRRVRGGGRGVE
jgi:hypothetical protein